MQQINSAMVQTVKGMSNAMKNMQVEQIANTMQSFEKQFEDMDVRSGLLLLLLLLLLLYCPLPTLAFQTGPLVSHVSVSVSSVVSLRIHGGHDGVHHGDIHSSRGGGHSDTGRCSASVLRCMR